MNPYEYYHYPHVPRQQGAYGYTPNPVVYPPVYPYRQFPAVQPGMFMSSAQEIKIILSDASTLLGKMAASKKFSIDLMTAAQESNKPKVDALIKSTGISKIPKVSYSPDGLRLEFGSNDGSLSLKLRWM